jgi:amidase
MSLYKNHVPSFDATVVERLDQAGAVLLGKLKTTEGALFSHHPSVTPPRNPRNTDYWSGVSSSGPGVAVAAGLAFGALGTDTGGSIRLPSACCGLTGIKPTWGRVSRFGVFPLANSLDCVGPMARSAIDAGVILQVVAGSDRKDPTALEASVRSYLNQIDAVISRLRIGVDWGFATAGVHPEVVAALKQAEATFIELGADVREIALPDPERVFETYLVLCSTEAAVAHKGTYPMHASEYGEELSELIERGRKTTTLQLAESRQERRRLVEQLAMIFRDIDALLTPTIPFPVPHLDSIDFNGMSIAGDSPGSLYSTSLFNVSGYPAISFPAGCASSGLPIGMQMVGSPLGEDLLLRAVHTLQKATDWHTRRSPVLGSRLSNLDRVHLLRNLPHFASL